MSAPRIDIDLDKLEHNTDVLAGRLSKVGIHVTGVTKATMGSPAVGAAMMRGGAVGLGDSRIPNLARLAQLNASARRTLIRSPMLSQVDEVIQNTTRSLNTEARVLAGLHGAAARHGSVHDVLLMVELGDLREGIAIEDIPAAVKLVLGLPSLRLVGLGANLACQNGVVPTEKNMDVLSHLVTKVEEAHGVAMTTVSGGNSANLLWATTASGVGRINDLRLGEAILLGVDPLTRTPVDGLHLDAFTLTAEAIEVAEKRVRPWGERAQSAYGDPPRPIGTGTVRQAIFAVGRQDIDPDGLRPPAGMTILGASSDHLVVAIGDHATRVGDEISFGLGYGALVRAMTSPFVTKVEHARVTSLPESARMILGR